MKLQVINDAVLKYGTPLYLYDKEIIIKQFSKLKYILPANNQIFYSTKANPLLGINQIFRQLGCGVEIASLGELHGALLAGYSPKDIIFTSPGKTYSELEYAIKSDIYSINIESIDEAIIINKIAEENSKLVNIAIRLNPDFNVSGAMIKMSGVASQFGIDQSKMKETFDTLRGLPNINVIGIHIYTGTQILDEQNLIRNVEEIIKLAIEISKYYKFNLEFLDFGGGFGIPYFHNESELDIETLKQGLKDVLNKYDEALSKTRIVFESGRFLMADSGIYLTRILYKKCCKGSTYLICDGGSNQNASSAFLGRYIRNNFPMSILGKSGDKEEVNVVGPLPTPSDIIGQRVIIEKAEPNDILVVEKSGAYGLTHSPTLFLSHPLPAEVIYSNGEYLILRERGKVEDFFRGQAVIPEEFLHYKKND